MKLPLIGLGTGRLSEKKTKKSLKYALNSGYNLIDTGDCYGNEEIIGKYTSEYKKKIIIITKYFGGKMYGIKNDLTVCFYKSLKKLKRDYIDIYLIHMPGACEFIKNEGWNYIYDKKHNLKTRINCWKELLILKKKGLVKYIGVSNWNLKKINELVTNNLDLPDVIEIEWCTCYRNFKLLEFCKKNKIYIIGYGNLRRNLNFSKYNGSEEIFKKENNILKKISEKYQKSVPEIILKWCSQHNIIVIPRSQNPKHIKNNINVINNIDFKLSKNDMKTIDNFKQENKGHSLHKLF